MIFSRKLVQRILSNRHIGLPDFSYAALSSIAVATADMMDLFQRGQIIRQTVF